MRLSQRLPLQSAPNLTSTVMLAPRAILLLFGVGCAAMVEGELGVCKREEMGQALFNKSSSFPWEDAQMRSAVRKVMLHLDLLGQNHVTGKVEKQFTLKMSQEDLLELQKYVGADGGPAGFDVESLLVQSIEMRKLQFEKPELSSSSSLPKFHLDIDHFNENLVIIFQV